MAGDDSYYYLYKLENNQLDNNIWLYINDFVHFILPNYTIISNLWVLLIYSVMYWFIASRIGNINGLILSFTFFISDTFYNKSVNYLDTHIPIVLFLIIITIIYLNNWDFSNSMIWCLLLVVLSYNIWNGYLYVVAYCLFLGSFYVLKDKVKYFLLPSLVVAFFSVTIIFSNYFDIKKYAISELIGGIIFFDNIILLLLFMIYLIPEKDYRLLTPYVFSFLPAIVFLRFNYFFYVISILLLADIMYRYIKVKKYPIILTALLIVTCYNFTISDSPQLIDNNYVQMGKTIDKIGLPVYMHYQQHHFMQNYMENNEMIYNIEFQELNYTCFEKDFIDYADNRSEGKRYLYYITYMDKNPKPICEDYSLIPYALYHEKYEGMKTILCIKGKYCLFERNYNE